MSTMTLNSYSSRTLLRETIREISDANKIIKENYKRTAKLSIAPVLDVEDQIGIANLLQELKACGITIFTLAEEFDKMINEGFFLKDRSIRRDIIRHGPINTTVRKDNLNEGIIDSLFSDPLEAVFGFGPLILDAIGGITALTGVGAPIGAAAVTASRGLSLVGCLYYTIKVKEAYDNQDVGAGFGAGLGLIFSAMAAGVPGVGSTMAWMGDKLIKIIKALFKPVGKALEMLGKGTLLVSTKVGTTASKEAAKAAVKASPEGLAILKSIGKLAAEHSPVLTKLSSVSKSAGGKIIGFVESLAGLIGKAVEKLGGKPIIGGIIKKIQGLYKSSSEFLKGVVENIASRAGKLGKIAENAAGKNPQDLGAVVAATAAEGTRYADEAARLLQLSDETAELATKAGLEARAAGKAKLAAGGEARAASKASEKAQKAAREAEEEAEKAFSKFSEKSDKSNIASKELGKATDDLAAAKSVVEKQTKELDGLTKQITKQDVEVARKIEKSTRLSTMTDDMLKAAKGGLTSDGVKLIAAGLDDVGKQYSKALKAAYNKQVGVPLDSSNKTFRSIFMKVGSENSRTYKEIVEAGFSEIRVAGLKSNGNVVVKMVGKKGAVSETIEVTAQQAYYLKMTGNVKEIINATSSSVSKTLAGNVTRAQEKLARLTTQVDGVAAATKSAQSAFKTADDAFKAAQKSASKAAKESEEAFVSANKAVQRRYDASAASQKAQGAAFRAKELKKLKETELIAARAKQQSLKAQAAEYKLQQQKLAAMAETKHLETLAAKELADLAETEAGKMIAGYASRDPVFLSKIGIAAAATIPREERDRVDELRAALEAEGIDPDKDIETLNAEIEEKVRQEYEAASESAFEESGVEEEIDEKEVESAEKLEEAIIDRILRKHIHSY